MVRLDDKPQEVTGCRPIMNGTGEFPRLLGSCEVAGLSLRNRIVMPPMVTAMEVGSDQFRAWYEARAKGGVGLVILQALKVEDLCTADYCEKLRPTVDAIKAHDVPVVQQLFQPDPGNTPTEQQLAEIVDRFADAAKQCKAIGIDGVEPHGAHGFFLNQMFSPMHSRRDDKYGGDREKRMTPALEIVRAIREQVGPGFPIFYRHTMEEPQGYSIDDSLAFVSKLVTTGVDVMDISPSTTDRLLRGCHAPDVGGWDSDDADCTPGAAQHANLAGIVKQTLKVPVVAVGGMESPHAAERALSTGKCDLCAVGRQLIADAQWANKVAEGRIDEIIKCTKCDTECFGNLRRGVPIGCVENPESGREYRHA